MRIRSFAIAAGLGATVMLSGCDKIKSLTGGKPEGQVAATVNGEEITALEVRAELGGFGSRDPEVMKAAQQQALQRIILRRLLAQEARKQKLDKSPDFTIQVARGEETLLAQLYERKLAATVTKPTKAEAEAFVAGHPDMFANRKVMFVDQVIAAPNKIAPDRIRPLKTLDQVKALLDSENVVYQQNAVVLDTLSADPRLVAGVNGLPPGEVFVIPQNGSLMFNQINGSRAVPFRGDMAAAYAMNVLRQQQAQSSVVKKVEVMRKAAEKAIVYNAAYKPPPPPAAKAPGAAAAAAPAAPAPK
ncbi:SurA N-terminal domain-containing protein [Phenylobacterium sp.]|uniref:SurA N-terminal domain-containing protein n=1 Tax=Phenylobacterium sp. TaxID=1871053 RepID=UPI0025E2D0C0|nr:SurA N-terminal domain-containing protein [Phenylobacterium sp.]